MNWFWHKFVVQEILLLLIQIIKSKTKNNQPVIKRERQGKDNTLAYLSDQLLIISERI